MENEIRRGGCVCGAVRYQTIGEPLRVTICHCAWCQRRTGTAFGTEVVFPKASVSFEGDTAKTYRHISNESGRWLDVSFCSRCGANLGVSLQAVPDIRSVPAGTYDDPTWIDPGSLKFIHVYVRNRRSWSEIRSDVDAYEAHFRR